MWLFNREGYPSKVINCLRKRGNCRGIQGLPFHSAQYPRQLAAPFSSTFGIGRTTARWESNTHMIEKNPVNSPVAVGSLPHYLPGFVHPRYLYRISQPSTAIAFSVWVFETFWAASSGLGSLCFLFSCLNISDR